MDTTWPTSSPYGDDDLAFIHPNGAGRVDLQVDLRECADHTSSGINVVGIGAFVCGTMDAPAVILVGGGRGGEGDYGEDSSDVDVRFSVEMFVPDIVPPVITCDAPDGQWHPNNVVLHCTATGAGSDLADPADAAFDLSTKPVSCILRTLRVRIGSWMAFSHSESSAASLRTQGT